MGRDFWRTQVHYIEERGYDEDYLNAIQADMERIRQKRQLEEKAAAATGGNDDSNKKKEEKE